VEKHEQKEDGDNKPAVSGWGFHLFDLASWSAYANLASDDMPALALCQIVC